MVLLMRYTKDRKHILAWINCQLADRAYLHIVYTYMRREMGLNHIFTFWNYGYT